MEVIIHSWVAMRLQVGYLRLKLQGCSPLQWYWKISLPGCCKLFISCVNQFSGAFLHTMLCFPIPTSTRLLKCQRHAFFHHWICWLRGPCSAHSIRVHAFALVSSGLSSLDLEHYYFISLDVSPWDVFTLVFSSHNFSSLRFFRGFFFLWICWPDIQNKLCSFGSSQV